MSKSTQTPNNNHVFAVMFISSLKISKSPNHPQIDVNGNVLSCPILLTARGNNSHWSNQWIPLSSLGKYPDWIVTNTSSACASRNRVKRGLRIGHVVEPFYNMHFISGVQPNMNHFGESIKDLKSFAKNVYSEIIGTETKLDNYEYILNAIIDYSIDSSLKELSVTQAQFDHRLERLKLVKVMLSKYLYSLVCVEKDFKDLYNADHYSDIAIAEINEIFAVYSMSLNVLHSSLTIKNLIKNYSAYAIPPVDVNS